LSGETSLNRLAHRPARGLRASDAPENPMRTRHRATTEDLRVAIHCLPRHTRVAMLQGIRSNEIIVGAYSSGGGICPMLAAYRNGGRTNMISFARAWDRFALRGGRRPKPRRATERELRVLITHLEASLSEDELPVMELAAAIDSHRRLQERHANERRAAEQGRVTDGPQGRSGPRPGDPDRSHELRSRDGWSWSRLFRSYNEYERALEWIEHERDALEDPVHQPA